MQEILNRYAPHLGEALKKQGREKEAEADVPPRDESKAVERREQSSRDAEGEMKRESKRRNPAESPRKPHWNESQDRHEIDASTREQVTPIALKALMDRLWVRALRTYGSHAALVSELRSYRDLCHSLSAQYPRSTFLTQYAARSDELLQKIDLLRVDYRNLEELGLSILGDPTHWDQGVVRKLRYLDHLYRTLSESAPLTSEESSAYEMVKRLLAIADAKKPNVSDRQLGMTFLSQLLGPLSRRSILDRYPSSKGSMEPDWAKLATDIRSGKLNEFLIMSNLREYLEILEKHQNKARTRMVPAGPRMPINEADPELEMADELDQAPHFYRDGAPLEQDFVRVVSGDMLMNAYRDPVPRTIPHRPKRKTVTMLLNDVSGSMGEKNK